MREKIATTIFWAALSFAIMMLILRRGITEEVAVLLLVPALVYTLQNKGQRLREYLGGTG